MFITAERYVIEQLIRSRPGVEFHSQTYGFINILRLRRQLFMKYVHQTHKLFIVGIPRSRSWINNATVLCCLIYIGGFGSFAIKLYLICKSFFLKVLPMIRKLFPLMVALVLGSINITGHNQQVLQLFVNQISGNMFRVLVH